MAFGKNKTEKNVLLLEPEEIRPNPAQPRRHFDEEAVQTLAQSIRRYGVLQPLTVRRVKEGYELIAGERRLRACVQAGLSRVPCVVLQVGKEESAILAVIENLQRQDLNVFEQACAIAALMEHYGLTQEETAARLSVSQSAVANKLRLLRLEAAVQKAVLDGGLSERHARALLRLPDESSRLAAAGVFVKRSMTVAQAEAYVEEQLLRRAAVRTRHPIRGSVQDVRLITNSLEKALQKVRRVGLAVTREQAETEEEYIFTVHIPKRRLA